MRSCERGLERSCPLKVSSYVVTPAYMIQKEIGLYNSRTTIFSFEDFNKIWAEFAKKKDTATKCAVCKRLPVNYGERLKMQQNTIHSNRVRYKGIKNYVY